MNELIDASFWSKEGQKHLEKMLEVNNIEQRAKNVIIFIGDGMGLASVTAGRIFTGQRKGLSGEEYKLNFEEFPNTGFSKVIIFNDKSLLNFSIISIIIKLRSIKNITVVTKNSVIFFKK